MELGLEDCVKDIDAQHIVRYALYRDDKPTLLSYPLESYEADVSGRSFHNGRFVQRMQEKAASLPNITMEEGTVTSLLEEEPSEECGTKQRPANRNHQHGIWQARMGSRKQRPLSWHIHQIFMIKFSCVS